MMAARRSHVAGKKDERDGLTDLLKTFDRLGGMLTLTVRYTDSSEQVVVGATRERCSAMPCTPRQRERQGIKEWLVEYKSPERFPFPREA